MADEHKGNTFAKMLSRLQKEPEAVAWPERRALAKAVCESLASHGESDTALGLMFQLADDPKWEVRKDIADCLLLDSDNPLLIDQPEDNLDNSFVYETIVESIRKVKEKRQLIFVTHNPNIPVLGDAEKVFVMESDGTSARNETEGTVDECKDYIVTLLEGGEEAFKKRKARYSY